MSYAEPIQRRIVAQIINWTDQQGTAQTEQGETFTLTGDYEQWAEHVGKKVEIFAEFSPKGELKQLEFRLLPKVLNTDNLTSEQVVERYGVSVLSEIDSKKAIAGERYWRTRFSMMMFGLMFCVYQVFDKPEVWWAAAVVAMIWGGGLLWSEKRLREHEARFEAEKQNREK